MANDAPDVIPTLSGRLRGQVSIRRPPVVAAIAAVVVLTTAAGACAPTIRSGRDDAQLTMRVKTALLNDPELGTEPITIVITGGVVHLSGRVTSSDQIERAERVVRSIEGVRDVESALEVGPLEFTGRDRPGRLPSITERDPGGPLRIVGLGVSGAAGFTPDDSLGRGIAVGPLIRLRPRSGLGPTLGFSWTRTSLDVSPDGRPGLADVIVRPVMGGVEYGVERGRLSYGVSLVGGYAFNTLRTDDTQAGPGRAIGIDNSLAARAGVGMWYDLTPRVGLNVFLGYRVTRPRVTFASDTDVTTHRLNGDAVVLSVGAAYWIF